MGRTSGGLGCQEGGYIRGKKLYSKGIFFFFFKFWIKGKEEKRKVNSVLLDIN